MYILISCWTVQGACSITSMLHLAIL